MANDRRNRGFRGSRTEVMPSVSREDLTAIIGGGDAVKINEVAKRLGEFYASGRERERLSSSQIRSILDRLQRMDSFELNELQLIRPSLAYAAGRHGGKVKHLQQTVDPAIQQVSDAQKFENLKNFFEAIVAYHRYFGGK